MKCILIENRDGKKYNKHDLSQHFLLDVKSNTTDENNMVCYKTHLKQKAGMNIPVLVVQIM